MWSVPLTGRESGRQAPQGHRHSQALLTRHLSMPGVPATSATTQRSGQQGRGSGGEQEMEERREQALNYCFPLRHAIGYGWLSCPGCSVSALCSVWSAALSQTHNQMGKAALYNHSTLRDSACLSVSTACCTVLFIRHVSFSLRSHKQILRLAVMLCVPKSFAVYYILGATTISITVIDRHSCVPTLCSTVPFF
jgi:hypothetical protein